MIINGTKMDSIGKEFRKHSMSTDVEVPMHSLRLEIKSLSDYLAVYGSKLVA
jgi:hypothetical protein